MRIRIQPDEVAAAAQQFTAAAADLEEALAILGPGEVAWVAARASRPMGSDGCIPSTVWTCRDSTWGARARVAARVQERVADVVVRGALEQRRLEALGAQLRVIARLWAEVEEGVGAALRRLDERAYRHPDVVERWADRSNRWVLGPLIRVGGVGGVFNERDSDVLALRCNGTRAGEPPASLADLIATDAEVTDSDGGVRVTEVVRADGTSAWIVAISGTQEWSPLPGDNPFDLTTDVQSVANRATLAAVGVHLALLQAQRSTGRDTSAEPVLVTGHSLGGILAATVAADPSFRHGRNIVGVVAAASPIAKVSVPKSVSVVAIEHRGDVVPLLDGQPNPTRPGWHTTITDPGPERTEGLASKAHAGDLYRESAAAMDSAAAAASQPPEWKEVIAPFVTGPDRSAVVHEFTLTREWQNPRT